MTNEKQLSGLTIEIILNRQLADCLSVPVFIVDPQGTLLFYNAPAEHILGKRYEDTGEMSVAEWSTMFEPIDEEGNPIPAENLPLVKTLQSYKPAHDSFIIKRLDGQLIPISVTSYPIIGASKKFTGAVAIFWSNEEDDEV